MHTILGCRTAALCAVRWAVETRPAKQAGISVWFSVAMAEARGRGKAAPACSELTAPGSALPPGRAG